MTACRLSKKFIPKTRFDTEVGQLLPYAYKKFWKEWMKKSTPLNFIPAEGQWTKNDDTNEVIPVQNVPIPTITPPEIHQGIWGGEAIVQGFIQKSKGRYQRRRVPRFWTPQFKRTVVKSEVMNIYLAVTVTDTAMNLIHENHGFDHYLLKTPANELFSLLALKLKKKILLELLHGCPGQADDLQKQNDILQEYGHYLNEYTPEEIEWYGLSWMEALDKITKIKEEKDKPIPLKHKFRQELINELIAKERDNKELLKSDETTTSWLSKVNIFGKKDTV